MVEWYNNEGDTSYLFQSFDERTRPLCKKISTSIFSLRLQLLLQDVIY